MAVLHGQVERELDKDLKQRFDSRIYSGEHRQWDENTLRGSFQGSSPSAELYKQTERANCRQRGRAKGRCKEESQRPPKGGEPSEPAYLAAKNLPTFAAKNLSTYGPHLEIARVSSQLEHN